ncbi:MAG: hypothetical protein NTW21_18675 [Verrucomicrobia bacterium]|nr:hypothetical protein [Verrucomicrobiota bacterium]
MPSIQSITEEHLIDAVNQAQKRIVFVAPGIWPKVALALADAWPRLGGEQVHVILDVDAEVCRFGYRVSQHTVTLPKHLVSIARKNKDLARKIESAVKLLDSEDALNEYFHELPLLEEFSAAKERPATTGQ